MLLMNWLRSVGKTWQRGTSRQRVKDRRRHHGRRVVVEHVSNVLELLEPRVLLAGITGYDTSVLASIPLGYWRLNETSGTTAADASGHGGTGTYSGGVVLGRPSPLSSSQAAEFDGTTGKVALAITPPTNNFTLEAVVQVTATHQIDGQSSTGTAGTSGQRYLFHPRPEGNGGWPGSVRRNEWHLGV